jgi:hypothetical protein
VLFGIIIMVLAIILVVLSAWLRLGNIKKKQRLSGLPEPQDSFLSREIKNVIANAGGIYVSLNLAASFLKLDVSQQFGLLGVQFDVLAAIALAAALLQPIVWPNSN